jgi:hypothetical protein
MSGNAPLPPPKVPPPPPPPGGGRRKTAWMKHVAATMKSEKSKKGSMGKGWFKHVLKTAKASYKKKGGSLPLSPLPLSGGRTRRRHRGRK